MCVKGVLVVVVTVPAGNKHKSSVSKEGSVVSSHIRNWKVLVFLSSYRQHPLTGELRVSVKGLVVYRRRRRV